MSQEIITNKWTSKKKKDVDFTEVVDKRISQIRDMPLPEALDGLFVLEKQTRQGGDIKSTIRVAKTAVQACFNARDFKILQNTLFYIAKRRGQMKEVVLQIVQLAMTFLPSIDAKENKVSLIESLRSITEGKIFVEIERANLTQILAKMKEEEGKISEAADILQEIQVETLGAMEPRDKITFILEQIRLCLSKNDYTRAKILSKKISNKALAPKGLEDLKRKYFELMVQYYRHEGEYLEVCRSLREIYSIEEITKNKSLWEPVLKLICIFVVLAPYDNEQSDLLHRIAEDRLLIELPLYQNLLKYFITAELARWPKLYEIYISEFNRLPVFEEDGDKLWKDLHSRVVEHNIRVVGQYYHRIRMTRLSQLLDLNNDETEKFISDMVSSKTLWAKIDRPKGVISFKPRQEPSDLLNNWSHDIKDLLNLLDKTCHLIHRETMVADSKNRK